MSKHLVIFYGRTGSTLVQNYVSKYKCSPEFNFTANGLPSSEIHADEHLMYYHNLSKVLSHRGVTDWCMKYHVLSGTTTLGTDPMPNGDYNITLTGSDIFFEGTGVTDLHFSFRIDIMDTILSYMIAHRNNTFVMTGGEIGSYTRRYYDREYVSSIFHQYSKNYQVYNAYVKKYTNEYNTLFYPYENLKDIIDIDNDPHGMVKQLTKEQKIDLVTNYDEVLSIAREFPFFHGEINEKTGILEYDK